MKPVPARKDACENCPFVEGTPLNISLTKGRLQEFKDHVDQGGWFPCHKSSEKRMELNNPLTADERGFTDWDRLDYLEKVKIALKEQECFGARQWKNRQA